MNTYNDDLRKNIVSALDTIETDKGKTKAQLDGSMFSLYYAEGTKISSKNKLENDLANWNELSGLSEEALKNKNRAVNLLKTANMEKEFVAQSETNTSVAAQNIQVAANAILKLASDVGSVYSIVSAADYGTEIFNQAEYANKVMDKTAYHAELTSRMSMQASSLAASVSAETVAEKATVTNQSITTLATTLGANVSTAHEVLDTSTATLNTASENEQKALGALEDTTAEYNSIVEAYKAAQEKLNLNLQVSMNEGFTTSPKNVDNQFTVSFSPLLSPFPKPKPPSSSAGTGEAADADSDTSYQPVSKYCLYIVKASNKTSFSLSTAESLNYPGSKSCQELSPSSSLKHKFDITPNEDSSSNGIKVYDTSGDLVVKGKDYVVFVMAVLTPEYKKLVNNFEDYLSASSSSFKLTNKLAPASAKSFKYAKNSLSFEVSQSGKDKEYRCMFLATSKAENRIVQEIAAYKRKIGAVQFQKMLDIKNDIERIMGYIVDHKERIVKLEAEMKKAEGAEKKALKKRIDREKSFIKNHEKEIKDLKKDAPEGFSEFMKFIQEREKEISDVALDFIFNKTIAEQISLGSYTPATPPKSDGTTTLVYTCEIGDSTTDNFGKRLDPDMEYIPVVLSCSTVAVEKLAEYENALSDFENTTTRVKFRPTA